MKAYLIDPKRRVVEAVVFSGSAEDIRRLIRADTFELTALSRGVLMYGDEYGLHRRGQHYCVIGDFPDPVPGISLVVGDDDADGKPTEPKISLEALRNAVRWLTGQEAVERGEYALRMRKEWVERKRREDPGGGYFTPDVHLKLGPDGCAYMDD